MIMSAQPTHVAKIKIQLFQHLVRMTYILVAWHFWPTLTWPESLTLQSVTKSNQWIFKKSCHEWNRSIVYIFMFFNNSTEILVSSAEPWSSSVWYQDRYGHVMSLSPKNNRQIILIIWRLFFGKITCIFVKIMNFGFTTDLVFLICRHGVHRLT